MAAMSSESEVNWSRTSADQSQTGKQIACLREHTALYILLMGTVLSYTFIGLRTNRHTGRSRPPNKKTGLYATAGSAQKKKKF